MRTILSLFLIAHALAHAGLAFSLILLILFWQPWIIVGVLIDIGIGVLSLGGKWPE